MGPHDILRWRPTGLVGDRPARDTEWDPQFAFSYQGTFFHSRAWAELWRKYTGGVVRPDCRLLSFSDGTVVAWPLSRRRNLRGLVHCGLSSPAGTFGGWLSRGELAPERVRNLVQWVQKHPPDLVWRLNPYNEDVQHLVQPSVDETTQQVDLRHGFPAAFKKWRKGHKAAAKQAERAGVEVCTARTMEDVAAYSDVYLDTVRRWGEAATTFYDERLFRLLWQLPRAPCQLWLARLDGRIVVGAILLYAHSTVVYWHGEALESALPKRPVHLMLREAMRDAADRDVDWFDFNPSGGRKGVEAFKRGFGTEPRPAPVVRLVSRRRKALELGRHVAPQLRRPTGGWE